ncbi:hypothetical protein [Clostridium weizhouense]|uniref:Lipoprotein n=1 Tax=Clostridium weizhouense TaxID=2859781 RepID=A0ABS7AL24_9CLOT|nr:hypothetical protein [Clostridium weizhouense]MBW6409332.1 hypothetical protein [Clostridium weizhouense]
MKKNKKILTLLLSILLVGGIMLTGCGDKGLTAVESAEMLFNLYVKQDTTKAEKLQLKKEELQSFVNQQEKALKSKIESEFKSYGLSISDEKLENICKAQLAAIAKVTPTIELVSEKDGEAEIKIKTTYLEFEKIDEKAADDAVAAYENSGITDEKELLNKMADQYVKNLIEGLNSSTPSTDTAEKTFKLKKDKETKIYIPDNIVEFFISIDELSIK